MIIYRTDKHGAPQSIITPEYLHKKAVHVAQLDEHGNENSLWQNEELETEAIVCMSQGMCGRSFKRVVPTLGVDDSGSDRGSLH